MSTFRTVGILLVSLALTVATASAQAPQITGLSDPSLPRSGLLEIGDCAVWVGVCSEHRDEAFRACRYVIDEIKHRLPIWKKEHYVNGDSGWVNCERCAEHSHS